MYNIHRVHRPLHRGEIFGSSGLTCALISENLIQTFCLYLPILELLTTFNDLHSLQSIYLYGIVYHFEYLVKALSMTFVACRHLIYSGYV